MTGRTLAGLVLVALGATACDRADPTGLAPIEGPPHALNRAEAPGLAERGALLDGLPVSFEEYEAENASLRITEITRGEDGDLLVDGVLSWAEDGVMVTEVFSDAPATLSRTAPMGPLMAAQRGADEAGVCDILYLDIGEIFLDLLGLTVDLAPIELDLDAQRGSGRLLGNLLCAVTGLLDGGPLAALDGLLDRVNQLLDSLTGLLSAIPVTGTGGATGGSALVASLHDGEAHAFEGLLTLTALSYEDGQLLASGWLEGTGLAEDGSLTEVHESFEDVPVSLSEMSGADVGPLMALQRAPNESGVCDVLYLDLGPIFLDVLGLTVDLAEVVLDVDAERGQGNLLGNLLCAVAGLLDGGLDLSGIGDLLDRITGLLGG